MNVSNTTDMALLNLQISEFRFQLCGISGNILAIFGLIGNVLSIVVLSHRSIRSSTSYYLITLAIYDNLILISMEVFFNLPSLSTHVSIINTFNCYYLSALPIGYPISLAAQMGSIYTTVAFTVERYIAVCRPFDVSNTCTKSRARKTMGLILLLVVLYNIPRYFQYKLQESKNSSCIQATLSEFGQHQYFRHVYLIYFHLIFMFLIPFASLLVLNITLIRAVKRSQRNIQQMSSSSHKDNNLTVMLISVIFVFLVCQFPSIIDNILLASTQKEHLDKSLLYQKFYIVCTFMVEFNSAVNFILYCVFGKKFRTVFIHIFCFKKLHKKLKYNSMLTRLPTNTRIKGSRCEIETSLV